MNVRALRMGLLLIAMAVGLATGCGRHSAPSAALAAPPDKESCDTEARQLAVSVRVYTAPDGSASPILALAAGHFVYRCEERGNWLGVMYPAVGEKVDCAERGPEHACALGWIRRGTHMDIFG
jgi:hypothetical protein